MSAFLTSFLYYAVFANIFLLIVVALSRKRVDWGMAEYPLLYIPWLCMYGLAVFTFEDAEAGVAANSAFLPFLSIVGGFFAAAATLLRIIWPKAEMGGFLMSCAGITLMTMLYMKFLALFFLIFMGD